MKLIWATRGETWGFRFLLRGNLSDPLPVYEEAFSGIEDDKEVCRRIGDMVALRFSDPEGRKDRAGRLIPHDFVVFQPLGNQVHSVEDGLGLIWPLVAETFEQVWDSPDPRAYPGQM